MKEPNYTREPIALFRQIKEKKKSSNLLHNLKSAYPKKLKIGAAIKTGDCLFDSMAQGLNELKPGHRFTAKSLREDCESYAEQHGEQDSWTYRAVIKDAAIGGYFAALEGPHGPIQDPKTKISVIDEERAFNKYLKDIKNMATGADSLPIWGRLDIEGRMICEKYKVKIEVIALEEEPIDDRYIATGEQGEGDNVVRIVNYRGHFVPLLSEIPSDITESQPVSNEEILGTDKRVPTSDQSEKEVQQEIINISTSAPVYADEASLSSHQPEQKTRQERINTSTSGINPPVLQDHTDRGIPTSDQSEKEVQQEIINTSTSAPVYTNKGIPSSHRQEQKTQQKGVQKKLINSYRKEAIYGTVAVIAAIVFTPSAIAAAFTQSIPLAFLAGIALVVACVCVYQLTQSHKDINELKSELGKDQKNSTHTFLEETGLKMHDLINKAISKV
ncbi:hypothetical protein [Wolbachia endosymbiont (group A) of Cheilosia soror]|uniref:hypothetical protein n=1 Tax=Wolbachia endosymbiont (group A) of Cheilosia soror TaxID=2953995 RepID=UPI0021F89BB0|nr:hypothetical protein [Wolbachia endosymbiont (group A) of Cheilosia soror]